MHEVINEKLGIKACRLADLTAEQLNHFLGQWEEGATIGTLTLFYDNNSGDIVLNKDNKLYESYLELTESYLDASEDVRKEIRENCPISTKETLDVLEGCVKSREIKEKLFLIKRQREVNEEYDMPWELMHEIQREYSFSNPRFWMLKAFQFGVMQGKRIERARHR